LLLGVKPGELDGPLASFQSTSADDINDTRRLIGDLILLLPEPHRLAATQSEALNVKWPITWKGLGERLASIPKPSLTDVYPEFDALFQRKTFQEATVECVNQRWLDRYDGARDTWRLLRERDGVVEQSCRPYVVDMYKTLIGTVDQYAMAISLLVGIRHFEIDVHGRVPIDPPGRAVACERSRKRIKSL